MARVIAICNQKGGVGKTTTAVNTAAYLATLGRRSLLVDFDPQANASSALGVNPMTLERSVYHGIIGQAEHQDVLYASELHNLHVIPSAPHLAGALVELVSMPEREYFLRKFLVPIRHLYDYIFIDLPPSMSLLTINGLLASEEVLIPVQTEYYSLEGLGQLLESINLIRSNLGTGPSVAGALITMHDNRERLSREVVKNLREKFPYHVFETEIPRNVALAEAPSFSKPIVLYRPDSAGAQAYRRFAEELIRGEGVIANAVSNFGDFNLRVSP